MKKKLTTIALFLSVQSSLLGEEVSNNGDFTVSEGSQEGFFSHDLWNRFGVGLQAGTNGVGGHLTYDLTNWLYLKAELGGLSVTGQEFDSEGVEYEGDLNLFAAGISLNFLPFEALDVPLIRGFRLTAGAYQIDHSIDLRSTGAEAGSDFDTDLGGFDPDGALTGSAEFSGFSPYVGIGWDWRIGKESGLTISLDAGVVFVGSAEVNLEDNTGIAEIAADLQEIEDDIGEETDQFEIYPVVQLGVSYRF